jgi:leader peptidase (prepilin peptidase) / N-methyltransferase
MSAGAVETLALAAIGACLGSFCATAALRLAAGEQPFRGRSHCDACGLELGYAETLPLISFFRLGGACTACGSKIDVLHLVGEACGVAIVLAAMALATPVKSVLAAALGLALLTTAVVDIRTQRLPDMITALVAALCAMLAAQTSIGRLGVGVLSAAVAFTVLELVRRSYANVRGQAGLGFGDVKLVAALALWLGPASSIALLIACIAGLGAIPVMRPANNRLAFGPSIAASAWLVGLLTEVRPWPR